MVVFQNMGTGYNHLLIQWPEILNSLSGDLIYAFPSFTIFLLVVVLFFVRIFGDVVARASIQLDKAVNIQKVTMWALHIISEISCTIIFFSLVDVSVLFQGTLFPSHRTGQVDDDWNDELLWVQNLNGLWSFIFWGCMPVIVLYIAELQNNGQVRVENNYNLVLLHHMIVFAEFFYGLRAFQSSFDARWIQMGLVMFLHIMLEPPLWLALFAYKFEWHNSHWYMFCSCIYEIVMRVVLWFGTLFLYSELCWTGRVFTVWEIVWRWSFPFVALVQIAAQGMAVSIHISLYKKSMKRKELGVKTPTPISARDLVADDNTIGVELVSPDVSDTDKEQQMYVHQDQELEIGNCIEDGEVSMISIPSEDMDKCLEGETVGRDKDKPEHEQVKVNSSGNHVAFYTAQAILVFFIVMFSILFASNILPTEAGFYAEVRPNQRIAVIGGGVAGLGTAWALQRSDSSNNFDVTLYEASGRLGGAAYSYTDENTGHSIDHAFASFVDYHNFEKLLIEINASSSYTSGGITAIFRNGSADAEDEILGASFSRLLYSQNLITKFVSDLDKLEKLLSRVISEWSEADLMTVSIGTLLAQNGFTDEFMNKHIDVCLQTYVSASIAIRTMPVALFYHLDFNYKLCLSASRVSARYIDGGSSTYVDKLVSQMNSRTASGENAVHFKVDNPVVAVRVGKDGSGKSVVRVKASDGMGWVEYDQIVFAVHRIRLDEILFHPDSNLCDQSTIPVKACNKLYNKVFNLKNQDLVVVEHTTTVHNDTDYIHTALSPLVDDNGCYNVEKFNYMGRQVMPEPSGLLSSKWEFNSNIIPFTALTFSCLSNLTPPFTITLPTIEAIPAHSPLPKEELMQQAASWNHTAHDVEYFRLGRIAHTLQGVGGMWYAGADLVINFHEDAFVSGLVMAHSLGAGYAFKDSALAEAHFQRIRAGLLFGLNPFLPAPTIRK